MESTDWTKIATLIIAILNLIGLPVLTGLIITDLFKRRKANSQEAKDKKKQERQDDVREVVKEETKSIKEDIVLLKENSQLTKESLQATLRHELYEIADKWSVKGYCPKDVKDDFENIYQKYHALGQNGVMTQMRDELIELPLHPKPKRPNKNA